MESLTLENLFGLALLGFIPAFYMLSPASKSTELWKTFYLATLASNFHYPEAFRAFVASVRIRAAANPVQAGLFAVSIGALLKYIQRKIRFAHINAI